jgi:Fe-S-cluster-containing dehydrogenase component/formate-dependent nitrite reductase membrane component NrfD
MRYGFVIDQDRCIGCHACTVACKEEHQVPVGVFRTWVKAIEKGQFPHTSRHFGVFRCNHCDSAPCVTICPTNALYRRSDGIIDFDNQRCIGCKSCMQACPYDALYMDPDTNTAAKCNFCAHRVEARLEPACVIVCPTQAIMAGDLDDPASKVSHIVATQKVSVRKPQKGTDPKLYYVGIEGDLLQPSRFSRQNGYAFAEQEDSYTTARTLDPSVSREVYDVAHPAPWGWKIAAYLWTKSIAAGVMLVAAILTGGGANVIATVISPLVALAALGVTGALLIFDLKRPDRFYFLLTKSNFRSWLVIGAYIMTAYGALCVTWLAYGWWTNETPRLLIAPTVVLAGATACYSAFLFAQAKGRDLWQSPLFFWHLLVQAFVAGSAIWLLASLYLRSRRIVPSLVLLLVFLVLSLCMTLVETALPHFSEDVSQATRHMVRGRLRNRFWGLAIGAGMAVPILLFSLLPSLPAWFGPLGAWIPAVAAILALAGIWWYEDVWVKAGQSVPLS